MLLYAPRLPMPAHKLPETKNPAQLWRTCGEASPAKRHCKPDLTATTEVRNFRFFHFSTSATRLPDFAVSSLLIASPTESLVHGFWILCEFPNECSVTLGFTSRNVGGVQKQRSNYPLFSKDFVACRLRTLTSISELNISKNAFPLDVLLCTDLRASR